MGKIPLLLTSKPIAAKTLTRSGVDILSSFFRFSLGHFTASLPSIPITAISHVNFTLGSVTGPSRSILLALADCCSRLTGRKKQTLLNEDHR